MRKPAFVPASRLYDLESQTPIAHPAHQATDEEVRQAIENQEARTDGGVDVDGTVVPAMKGDRENRDEVPAEMTKSAFADAGGIRSRSGLQGAYEASLEWGINAHKQTSCLQLLPKSENGTTQPDSQSENSTRNGGGSR